MRESISAYPEGTREPHLGRDQKTDRQRRQEPQEPVLRQTRPLGNAEENVRAFSGLVVDVECKNRSCGPAGGREGREEQAKRQRWFQPKNSEGSAKRFADIQAIYLSR